MITCTVCKKRRDSGMILEPDARIPEIKKTVCFCSRKCENIFINRIIKNRKKALRSRLEASREIMTEKDESAAFSVLTPKEKESLAMAGLFILLARGGNTCEGFFQELKTLMLKRAEAGNGKV